MATEFAPARVGVSEWAAPGPADRLLLPLKEHQEVTAFLSGQSSAIDRAGPGSELAREAVIQIGSRLAAGLARRHGGGEADAPELELIGRTIASVAWNDLSVAFSLWCHRMVIEYLATGGKARNGRPCITGSACASLLPSVTGGELIGSSALAPAMAKFVNGAPLTVSWREEHGGEIVLDGNVRWASNLFPPHLVLVTAATHVNGGRDILVAIPGGTAGIAIDPHPPLLALQATGSSSLTLNGVRLSRDCIVTDDLTDFIGTVRGPFLLLQSSFCLGLATRAIDEAASYLRVDETGLACTGGVPLPGSTSIFIEDYQEARATLSSLSRKVAGALARRGNGIPPRDIVALRLESARMATAAVALEARLAGGASFVASSGTARRLREAAFLPVQAPTEGQLRWELSRSA